MLLKSLHLDIQHEGNTCIIISINSYSSLSLSPSLLLAGLLIKDLLEYEEIQQPLLMGLVTLLKHEDLTSKGGGGRSNNNNNNTHRGAFTLPSFMGALMHQNLARDINV